MKFFCANFLDDLTTQAQCSLRKRQHHNIHESYSARCQCLFNAIEPGSYIRPHRHDTDSKDELLIAVRGVMALVTFNEQGKVIEVRRFGADKNEKGLGIGVELSAKTWHTVIALEPGCILLEVKEGPFNPDLPKDLATWAPDEGTEAVNDYLNQLMEIVAR